MNDVVTYLPEPEIALAPGAFGGLVILADGRQPFPTSADALAVVQARLPMVQDVAWDRATIELRHVGARYRYTIFVPLAAPSTRGECAPVPLDQGSARHRNDEDAASLRRALMAAVQGRADAIMALVDPAQPLAVGAGAAIMEYARDSARADIFSLTALRSLFDRGGLLIDELVHGSTTLTPQSNGGVFAC